MRLNFKHPVGYMLVLGLVLALAIVVTACSASTMSTPSPRASTLTPSKSVPVTPPIISSPSASIKSSSPTAEASRPATQTPAAKSNVVKRWATPPQMQIDPSRPYFATIDTNLGSFKIHLFANETPRTVNNFVFLSQQAFYEGVIFHRIVKDFMIQTGDPTGTGMGNPGYQFADELPPYHLYGPGIVAMANSGPNTNGSQFFICTGTDAESLNQSPNYTQFGQVVGAMDIVQKIASVPVGPGNPGENSRPINPPVINKIVISSQ
jgi:cyclophilin family peptidyl-prolyl cis-trans isomerase